jgi:hypothetical protein
MPRGEHARVRERSPDVGVREPAVEADGCGVALDELGNGSAKRPDQAPSGLAVAGSLRSGMTGKTAWRGMTAPLSGERA